MKDNLFFKPTPIYKEYKLLDLLEKDPIVTQRELSKAIESSISMINSYIDEYEKKGFLKRVYFSNKNVEYHITKKGIERKKLLNLDYLKYSHAIYNSPKDNIVTFLKQIINKGYKNIILYGAGEFAELLLLVMNDKELLPINVVALIDDNEKKQGNYLKNYPIISYEKINDYHHEGILISSYRNKDIIYSKLIAKGYDKENILMFFEL